MQIEPSRTKFEAAYNGGKSQLVWTQTVADLETPVSAFLKLTKGAHNCFLFESVEGGAVRGRYSILGMEPDLVFRARGDKAEINAQFQSDAEAFEPVEAPTLDALRTLIRDNCIDVDSELPPMAAGIFGYLGYDTVRQMEKLPEPNEDVLGLPDVLLIRPTIMAIFDAVKDTLTLVTPVRPQDGVDASNAHSRAVERLTKALDRLDNPVHDRTGLEASEHEIAEPVSNTPPEEYAGMVAKAKDYIGAGDIFQVVLSQRFETPFTLPPFSLYRSLRRTNPSPFLYYLDFDGFSVVGSSPEILVRVRDEKVTIRPIAGTRRRGHDAAEDKALADELLNDPKELAEHLMLLDLGRNDVGRVSKIGSVEVTDQFFLEYYSQVMHIVSNVVGDLDTDRFDALDALSAGFPAGTVSGAPKVRAMEIIDELERHKRGVYAGCVGYFSADGAMDTCIVLRTAIVKDGVMHVQAGAGIVADSDPRLEQKECINKAKALFAAASDAVKFASQAKRGQ